MPDLTVEQQELYDKLKNAIIAGEDIYQILQRLETFDLVPILAATDEQGYTLLKGSILSIGQLTNLLTVLREKILLKEVINEVINVKICFSASQNEKKYISLIESMTNPNHEVLPVFLKLIEESCSLETFIFVIDKDDCMKIKETLESINSEDEIYVKALGHISNTYREKENIVSESNLTVEDNSASPTSKAIVVGAICSIIAGLAVGGGCFAAGVALPMLALIGIAVAAALATGLIIGVNTHAILSKPNSELNGADAQQKVSQESEVTA